VSALTQDIITSRLRLWLPGSLEASAVLRYFEHNRGHLEPWEPVRPTDFYTLGFWQKRLVENRQDAELGRSLRYFLQLVGDAPPAVVGAVNFTNVIRGAFCACHLGYGLAQAEQGKGLMREALTAALPEVAARLSLHRVMANYQPQNERSGRLLEQLGFVREGYAKDYLFIDGSWRDHVLTARVFPI